MIGSLVKTRAAALALAGTFAVSLLGAAPAGAGPLCSTLSGLTLATFESCTVVGGGPAGQDSLANVQTALNGVFAPNTAPTLIPGESYYPTNDPPGKAGDEFQGDVAGLFEVEPDDINNNITFSFSLLPPNTVFLTMKAGNGFEIFNLAVTGTTNLTHQLTPDSTSHFSTFAANVTPPPVPEPASLVLLGGALLGFGLLRRRKRR